MQEGSGAAPAANSPRRRRHGGLPEGSEIEALCVVCAVAFVQVVRRRRRLFCSKECRAIRLREQAPLYAKRYRARHGDSGLKDHEKTCEVCARPFTTKLAATKTCGRLCGTALSQLTCHATRSANAATRKARKCERCGIDFIQGKLGKKQRASGHVQRYCSRMCSAAAARKYATPAEAKRAEHERAKARRHPPPDPPLWRCTHCDTEFRAARSRLFCCADCRHAANRKTPTPAACDECGVEFLPSADYRRRKFCAEGCARRHSKRIAKAKREARERTDQAESVNPFKVFSRDGWRCYICGVDTPRSLRGTNDPRAPELEHVVPLARGGSHTYENTACACRACNGAKGTRLPAEIERVAA